MRGSGRTRFGSIAAALTLALGTTLGGSVLRPAPVSAAAFCTDFPDLCTTYNVAIGGDGTGTVTSVDGFISCSRSGGVTSGTCSHRYPEDGNGAITVELRVTAEAGSYPCYYKLCKNDLIITGERTVSSSSGVVNDGDSRFFLENCSAVEDAWCERLSFDLNGNGYGHIETADGLMYCSYDAGAASGLCSRDYFIGPEHIRPLIHVDVVPNSNSLVCEGTTCGSGGSIDLQTNGDATLEFTFVLKPPTPPPATPHPQPTPGPGATARPSQATPGSTSGAGSSPPGSGGSSAIPATAPASLDPTAQAIASSTSSPGGSPTGSAATGSAGQPSDARGADVAVLSLAILAAAVIVAIGLAVGLRGRRRRSDDDDDGPHAGPTSGPPRKPDSASPVG